MEIILKTKEDRFNIMRKWNYQKALQKVVTDRQELIDQTYLKSRITYDPITGIFTWKKKKAFNKNFGYYFYKTPITGKVAGYSHDTGYILISLRGKNYLAHRLAWLYMTGEWPDLYLDHKNNIKNDNRFDNLRPATHQQNMQNRLIPSNNTSGYKGVKILQTKEGPKFATYFKKKYLGCFLTAELAAIAYNEAAIEAYGDFSSLNFIEGSD